MYSADSLTTQYITDPIAVYSSQVKRNEVIIDNTVSKSTKIFIRFVLLDRLEGKEPEMGHAYSLQVKRSGEVRC